MALETLGLRREGLSPSYVLLVPTFSLLNAPHHLTVYASQQFRMLLYHPDIVGIRSFGTILSPDTFSARKLLTSELLRYL